MGHDEGWHCCGARHLVRAQEVGVLEDGLVLPAWVVQAEAPDEACHEGRREGGLRQGGDGEGQACAEGREGLPGGSPEEEHLSREPVALACSLFQSSCRSAPDCAASRGHSAEVASSARRYTRTQPLAEALGVTVYARGSLQK